MTLPPLFGDDGQEVFAGEKDGSQIGGQDSMPGIHGTDVDRTVSQWSAADSGTVDKDIKRVPLLSDVSKDVFDLLRLCQVSPQTEHGLSSAWSLSRPS